jgi:hypothetical protein
MLVSFDMKVAEVPSNKVRVPTVRPGEACVITRYGTEEAVVMHPDDFRLFKALLDTFGDRLPRGLAVSESAARLHELSERGEDEDDFDYAGLSRALG